MTATVHGSGLSGGRLNGDLNSDRIVQAKCLVVRREITQRTLRCPQTPYRVFVGLETFRSCNREM